MHPLRLSVSSDSEPAVLLPIDALSAGDSPRLAGENRTHTRLLAESDSDLPPILVHRRTLAIIDGVHRVNAALLNGRHEIPVQFLDVDDDEAFVAAVRANNAHGLPLTLADKRAATERIVRSNPLWSDRSIAEAVALAPQTVAKIRRRSTVQNSQSNSRLGRDGRVRPLSAATARVAASQVIRDRPTASLREIARESGVSIATARDVRERLRRGLEPVPSGQRTAHGRSQPPGRPSVTRSGSAGTDEIPGQTQLAVLWQLRRDPSLRLTENGRSLLRWLARDSVTLGEWDKLADHVPPHCLRAIARLAECYSRGWAELAGALLRKADAIERS